MYRVKDVMTDEVLTCGPEDCLATAVEIMRDRGCGCVPVVDSQGGVVGLLTDRDAVMCALRLGKRLSDIRVGEACSREVITCARHSEISATAGSTSLSPRHIGLHPIIESFFHG